MEEAGVLISVVCVVVGLTARIDIKGITRDGRRCTLSLMGRVSGMRKPSLDRGGAPSVDGTRGTESRQQNNEPQLNSKSRSGEVKFDPTSNMLDMTKLPPAAMALLQQLLVTILDKGKAQEVEKEMTKGESGTEVKTDIPESSAQGAARSNSKFGKPPYCYSCLSRGHPKVECTTQLVCEICDSTSHVKARCTQHKEAVKSFAMTCGYAVDGLGFYYIPHSAVPRNKEASKTVVIKVIQGNLTVAQVQAEMERLVPEKGQVDGGRTDSKHFQDCIPV
jgi:hypothetical protein